MTAATGHAVARLRSDSLANSKTRPRLDRDDGPGSRLQRFGRCERCRLVTSHCMCELLPKLSQTHAAVCLIMGEFEALKPSNTGWLVADLLPETRAFSWSRTEPNLALLALLADPQWQPYLVFPGEFSAPERVVSELSPNGKRPLFILLDGTWSEARKIFRKSPYLDRIPVLSLQPEQLSRYRLRRSSHDHHFCTSEVAALCLALAGDGHAAQTLEAWFDVFSNRYLSARQSVPADPSDEAHQRLQALVQPT